MKYRCFAACMFGLESCVATELSALGAENLASEDARVYFDADEATIARVNINIATADRIYIVLSEFTATTFDELFEGVRAIDFGALLPKNARMNVTGDAVKSTLMSVSDIQAITKKAVVEALKRKYALSFYREDGEVYGIYAAILRDRVSVCLNTSGQGLNRRGYRVKNVAAPLRETLAAGLIRLTRWRDRPFYDPLCGSGTIAIEAALKAAGIAPGLDRAFDAQSWNAGFANAFARAKEQAVCGMNMRTDVHIYASDKDPKAVDIARYHAKKAGVSSLISFACADIADFAPTTDTGAVITNPPYAARLGEKDEVHALYKTLGERLLPLEGYKYYIITADRDFERWFGKNADKKRKLYNGNMRCDYYQYFR